VTNPAPAGGVPVIHVITDDLIITRPAFSDRARSVMGVLGPRGALHVRARVVPAMQLYVLAEGLVDIQAATGCWLVVNDRVDIALAADARGAQLTSRSLVIADARAIAPGLALGASVHSAEGARAAEVAGADWVVAGHVFQTASHPAVGAQGVPFMAAVRAATRLPCIAIGGIRPTHVRALRAAGVYGVAAISGIWGAADAERAASDYLSAYDDDCKPR
jgi:thiamine-phosphate diphosphorylase